MAVMDEFKEQREAIKNGTPKEKFMYFLDYYKWHVIISVIAVVAVVSFIIEIVNQKDHALYVCMLNSINKGTDIYTPDETATEQLCADFAEYIGLDTSKYDIYIDTSLRIHKDDASEETMYSTQKFVAQLAAAELDVMITDDASMQDFSYQQDFHDLRDILSPEQLAELEPYFYYIDMATVAKREEISDDPDNLFLIYELDYPNPRNPEAMEEPIPVGIYMNDCMKLTDNFYFETEDIVMGFFVNSTRVETALQYLEFLMEE